MNKLAALLLILVLLMAYPVYADTFQDITNFFVSIYNSIVSFFNSAGSVLFPKTTSPSGGGGGGGGGGGAPSGGTSTPPSCSGSLSLSSSGIDTCTITASFTASYCDDKSYEIKDSSTKCSGTISGNSSKMNCNWQVTSGTYTYTLYIDGASKASSSVTCSKTQPKCTDGTSYSQCSSNKPLYCDNGNLVDKCSRCGCPSGQNCNSTTNYCYIPQNCGNNKIDSGEQCELSNTNNNNYCSQSTSACNYTSRKYCTRDSYGNCNSNCQCVLDSWGCGSVGDSNYCNNCNHCGDGSVNCGETQLNCCADVGCPIGQTCQSDETCKVSTTYNMIIGINYMSAGNQWVDTNSQLDADFSRFSNDGIKHISVRIMWSVMEPTHSDSSTTLDVTSLSNIKRVLTEANKYGIKVNLDFWTQHDYTLGLPSWVGSYWDIEAIPEIREHYVRYMQAVVNQLKSYPAIESWTVLNEPWFGTASDGTYSGKAEFQSTFPVLYDGIKSVDPSHIVTCRFTLSYTPGSGRFDASVYDIFDVFAITEYLDPSNPSDTRGNGRWLYWDKTVSDLKARNEPLWVIEFGDDNSDTEHVRLHYEQSLQKFNDTGIVQRSYAWAWQTRSASSEGFNIYDGTNPKPAYYELAQNVQTCSDGTLYGQCSPTKPKYCSSGTLINKCSQCGCSSDQVCNTTSNSCYIPSTDSSGWLHTSGTKILNDKNEEVNLNGIGTGFAHWNMYGGELVLHESDIQNIRNHGLNSIRPGFNIDNMFFNQPKPTSLTQLTYWPDFWEHMDSVVNACRDNGIWVWIDYHPNQLFSTRWVNGGGTGFPAWTVDGSWSFQTTNFGSDDEAYKAFWNLGDSRMENVRTLYKTIWKDIATRYKSYENVVFNLWNEPFMDKTFWTSSAERTQYATYYRTLMEQTIDVIQAVDGGKHIIVVDQAHWSGGDWSMNEKVNRLNVVVSRHLYANHFVGTTIKDVLDEQASYAWRYNQPIIWGEFGLYEGGSANSAEDMTLDQIKEFIQYSHTMKKSDSTIQPVGWMYWEYNSDPNYGNGLITPYPETWQVLENNLYPNLKYCQ